MNNKLTDAQKSFIRGTPFGWMVELTESVKMSRNLLTPLISRWVERLGGFDMSAQVVGFTYLDVCLGLGLRVVGENIDLNQEGLNSDSRNLFGASQVVDIDMVYDYILKHIKVLCLEDFGKLYVLLAIYLPNLNTWNICGWRNHHLQYVLHISRVSRLHVGMQIWSEICVDICVWTGIFTRLGISFHILFHNIVKSHHRHRSLNFFFSGMSDVILENLQML